MTMLLIEGTYRVVGTQPDGDSVRFYPNDPAEWARVDRRTRCITTPAAARSSG
jgi:hypothetical protein